MQKYRYIEFVDRTSFSRSAKSGRIYIVGEVTNELIDELNLQEVSRNDFHGYYSSLADMATLGWELAFVTPCAINMNGNLNKGPIENSYIFKKNCNDENN